MDGIYIELRVEVKYITYGAGGTSIFTVPMFDFGYVLNYSYSDVSGPSTSASGQEFPEYNIARNLYLIKKFSLSWNGMTLAEKLVFENFIKSFNNSFQPFIFRLYTAVAAYDDYYMIIEPDSLTFTKDKFDLWGVSLTCIELESL